MLNLAEEKRLYTRIRSEAAVKIYYGGFMLARCKTINLCVGGVLVHVKEVGLTENSLIQIMFDVASTHCLFDKRMLYVQLLPILLRVLLSVLNSAGQLVTDCP